MNFSSVAQKTLKAIKSNFFTICNLSAVAFGVGLGFLLKNVKNEWSEKEEIYIGFAGEIFISLLKLLIVTLIIPKLVCAVGSMEAGTSTKITIALIVWYVMQNIIVEVLSIVLVAIIQPGMASADGGGSGGGGEEGQGSAMNVADTILDLLRNMFPSNVIEATMFYKKTDVRTANVTNGTSEEVVSTGYVRGTNNLGLVVFAVAIGTALRIVDEKGKPLLALFDSVAESMTVVARWIMWFSPIGLLSLVTAQILGIDDFSAVISELGLYILTVLVGLAIYALVLTPIAYTVFMRELPFRFYLNMAEVIPTAIGTSSSLATYPITLRCLEEKNHVDPKVSRFVLPIGTTINMTLISMVSILFICQLQGIELGIGQTISACVMLTLVGVGAAGVPQDNLILIIMVVNMFGLPSEDLTRIIAVEWFIDRFSCVSRIYGDAVAVAVINKWCGSKKESTIQCKV